MIDVSSSVTAGAGQEREARNRWKEDAGTRSGVFQIRDSGSSSIIEPGSRNIQPLMAGGKEYGFETSVSHMIHRTQGVQLSDKGDDGSNVFQPTRCRSASQFPNRFSLCACRLFVRV